MYSNKIVPDNKTLTNSTQ